MTKNLGNSISGVQKGTKKKSKMGEGIHQDITKVIDEGIERKYEHMYDDQDQL